jgi:hypothetical protein
MPDDLAATVARKKHYHVEAEDFWRRVRRSEQCWIWTGPLSDLGYGKVMYRGRHWRAHRLAYTLSVGPIPTGVMVCHRCDVPACVNPAHLWLGTGLENVRDRDRKGRHAGTRRTSCPRSHPYDVENTRFDLHGKRHCRACERRRSLQARAALAALRNEPA